MYKCTCVNVSTNTKLMQRHSIYAEVMLKNLVHLSEPVLKGFGRVEHVTSGNGFRDTFRHVCCRNSRKDLSESFEYESVPTNSYIPHLNG